MMTLRELIFVAMASLAPGAEHTHDASRVAAGIELAVSRDTREPFTGTREGDATLMVVYAWRESAFDAHARGDGGQSLGAFQLQRLPLEVAFDPVRAASIWLARAHDSTERCAANPEPERLAALVSGSCGRGRVLSRQRWVAGGRLLGWAPNLEE